jgi:hypothetical protein
MNPSVPRAGQIKRREAISLIATLAAVLTLG